VSDKKISTPRHGEVEIFEKEIYRDNRINKDKKMFLKFLSIRLSL